MPYTLTRKANHTIEISAELDPDAVSKERGVIVKSIRHKASVPGFRRGKAPEAAVRARYAEEIHEELQEHLTGVLWREVFDGEEELSPLTNPQMKAVDFAEDGGFSFTAELEVRPEYELPEIEGLTLPEVSLDISDPEIDAELAKIQEEQAVWQPADDEEAADGMLIEVDLEGRVEDVDDEPYSEKDASSSSARGPCHLRSTRRFREPRSETSVSPPRSCRTILKMKPRPVKRWPTPSM
jgi:trigger factor